MRINTLGRLGLALSAVLFTCLQCATAARRTRTAASTSAAAAGSQTPGASSPTPKKGEGSEASSAPASKQTEPGDELDPSVYRIGIDDDLQISVWKEPDLSTTVVVRPDGMITLPLLNDVYVVGLKTSELQALLTEKLKPFVNEPQVTVIVRGIKSRKVYVFGQVARVGAYPLVQRKTVLELLAEAGGLGPFAKKGSIYILREVDHKKVRIPFNYNDALKGKGPKDGVELLPGDIVVVP